MERIKDRLRNFRKNWSVSPWERNVITNMRDYIDAVDLILIAKIQEVQECEERIGEIKRTIRLRRIKVFFKFFSH